MRGIRPELFGLTERFPALPLISPKVGMSCWQFNDETTPMPLACGEGDIGSWPATEVPRVRDLVAIGWIVLQNSFLGCVQNFPGALVRVLKNYVRGHMIDQISNRQPS